MKKALAGLLIATFGLGAFTIKCKKSDLTETAFDVSSSLSVKNSIVCDGYAIPLAASLGFAICLETISCVIKKHLGMKSHEYMINHARTLGGVLGCLIGGKIGITYFNYQTNKKIKKFFELIKQERNIANIVVTLSIFKKAKKEVCDNLAYSNAIEVIKKLEIIEKELLKRHDELEKSPNIHSKNPFAAAANVLHQPARKAMDILFNAAKKNQRPQEATVCN